MNSLSVQSYTLSPPQTIPAHNGSSSWQTASEWGLVNGVNTCLALQAMTLRLAQSRKTRDVHQEAHSRCRCGAAVLPCGPGLHEDTPEMPPAAHTVSWVVTPRAVKPGRARRPGKRVDGDVHRPGGGLPCRGEPHTTACRGWR